MTTELRAKVEASSAFLRGLRYKNIVFMCSFGKDSMVLLDLIFKLGMRFPIVFHRDPWWPEKYAFADKIIAANRLEVHDYPPSSMYLWERVGTMAFTSVYQIGKYPVSVLHVPKNIIPPEPGVRFLCGLKDVLARPTGGFNYPWDCALVGHKNSDEDQIAGKIPLVCDIKLGNGFVPDLAFPLRNWTDADIWDYTLEMGVPVQLDRYDPVARKELDSKLCNSDYAHVCIACIDRRSKAWSVLCPKLGCEVNCIPELVPYQDPPLAGKYFGNASG